MSQQKERPGPDARPAPQEPPPQQQPQRGGGSGTGSESAMRRMREWEQRRAADTAKDESGPD